MHHDFEHDEVMMDKWDTSFLKPLHLGFTIPTTISTQVLWIILKSIWWTSLPLNSERLIFINFLYVKAKHNVSLSVLEFKLHLFDHYTNLTTVYQRLTTELPLPHTAYYYNSKQLNYNYKRKHCNQLWFNGLNHWLIISFLLVPVIDSPDTWSLLTITRSLPMSKR